MKRMRGGAVGWARRAATWGTLPTRLLAAGVLLVVGLPVLSILLYMSGYPAAPVPLAVVAVVDGLQLLIVAYAAVVAVQLASSAGGVRKRLGRSTAQPMLPHAGERPVGQADRAVVTAWRDGWTDLPLWSRRLAEVIWEQERRGRPEFGPAALAYVRDAVVLELEYRRRAAALEQRAAELTAWTIQDSVVASERM